MPTDTEIRSWYDRKYAALGANAYRPPNAYPVYLESLDVKPGTRLLDVSCGTGQLLLAAAGRDCDTYGVDLSPEAVRVTRQVTPGSKTLVCNAESLSFASGSFDSLTCLGSLEHFPRVERSLQEMLRVTKRDARFCFTVPNSNFLLWRIFPYGTAQQAIFEQPRSLKQWTELFEAQGFRVLTIKKERWDLKRPRFLGGLEALLLRLLWMALPLRQTYQFHFVLGKAGRG